MLSVIGIIGCWVFTNILKRIPSVLSIFLFGIVGASILRTLNFENLLLNLYLY